MNEGAKQVKLTDKDVACLVWNTMYPDRRPFHKLEESTKDEWSRLVHIARDIFEFEAQLKL